MATCDYLRDCSKVPIPSKCIEYCLERLLRTATLEEKQLILGLDRNTAQAVFAAYNRSPINSFDDLRRSLTNEQIDHLLGRFKQINQFQLNYFRRNRIERDNIIDGIRDLRLDIDDTLDMDNTVSV